MECDTGNVDELTMALLYLTTHEKNRLARFSHTF